MTSSTPYPQEKPSIPTIILTEADPLSYDPESGTPLPSPSSLKPKQIILLPSYRAKQHAARTLLLVLALALAAWHLYTLHSGVLSIHAHAGTSEAGSILIDAVRP